MSTTNRRGLYDSWHRPKRVILRRGRHGPSPGHRHEEQRSVWALGAGLGALMGKVEKTGIDKQFQQQVRDLIKPGNSALFLIVEKVAPDKAVAALSKFGGTVLKSSLSGDAERQLQDELHGGATA